MHEALEVRAPLLNTDGWLNKQSKKNVTPKRNTTEEESEEKEVLAPDSLYIRL